MIVNWVMYHILDIDSSNNSNYSQVMRYFLTVCFIALSNLIRIIFFSVILRTIVETFTIYLVLIILRPVAGGWHAKSKNLCIFQSVLFYTFIPYLIKNLQFELNLFSEVMAIFIFFLIFYSYAPQGTETEPVSQDSSKKLKKKSLHRLFMLIFICMLLPANISLFIFYSILIQSIMIIPITKKIIEGSFI